MVVGDYVMLAGYTPLKTMFGRVTSLEGGPGLVTVSWEAWHSHPQGRETPTQVCRLVRCPTLNKHEEMGLAPGDRVWHPGLGARGTVTRVTPRTITKASAQVVFDNDNLERMCLLENMYISQKRQTIKDPSGPTSTWR